MSVPTNLTAATAIDLGDISETPVSGYTQQVDDGATVYDVWHTFMVQREGMVSILNRGPLTGGSAVTFALDNIYEGSPDALVLHRDAITNDVISGNRDAPFQIYLTPGRYYFQSFHSPVHPTLPAILTIDALQLTQAVAPVSSIVVPDDELSQAAIMDQATGQVIRFEVFSVCEVANAIPDGTIISEDEIADEGVALWRIVAGKLKFIRFIDLVGQYNIYPDDISANQLTGMFYIFDGAPGVGNPAKFVQINNKGSIIRVSALTTAGGRATAPSPDDSILYISGFPTSLSAPIKRWDIISGVFLSDLIAAPTGTTSLRNELLCMADGTVIHSYFRSGEGNRIRGISPAGSVLWDIVSDAAGDSEQRQFYISSDPTIFGVWIHLANSFSRVVYRSVATGAVVTTLPDVAQFEGGASEVDPSLTPLMFGHSNSCPMLTTGQVLGQLTPQIVSSVPCCDNTTPPGTGGPTGTGAGPGGGGPSPEPNPGPVLPPVTVDFETMCQGGGEVPTAADIAPVELWDF